MRWRWHCRNFRGQKDVFPAEVSEAPSPQRSTGSRAEAEFGKYRVKPRRLRGHETGMRIEERAVKDQQAFSRWATFFSNDWQCERWATPSFLDYLSVSGSVLLLDLSKCELLKTQYPTQTWFYNGYAIMKQHFLTWLWLALKWNVAWTHPIRVTPLLTFDSFVALRSCLD